MKARDPATGRGAAAALLWLLLCLRWFDVAALWRPAILAAIPPVALAALTALAVAAWLRARWGTLAGLPLGSGRRTIRAAHGNGRRALFHEADAPRGSARPTMAGDG